MTRRLVLFVACLALVGSLWLGAPAAHAQGIVLDGLRGGQLSEGELNRGSNIVLVFASWSPRGKDIHARANQINSRWGSRARVVLVDFQEDRSQVESFLQGKNVQPPVYLDTDGSFSKKYAVTTLPSLLVLQDGNVAFRGALPDDPDRVLGGIFP